MADNGAPRGHELLRRITAAEPPPFALLYRPEHAGSQTVDVLVSHATSTVESVVDIPLPENPETPGDQASARHDVLALIPYRQITERGFHCTDDATPLVVLPVDDQATVPVEHLLRTLPDTRIDIRGGGFDVPDDEYAETVKDVLAQEIGKGAGANFVISRSFVADVEAYTPADALTLFRRLLESENGAYWTFIVHTGDRTLVGATPERHISVRDGVATMNPISGTYRYPRSGPTLSELIEFLADKKEIDELYMVVDEELKMMSGVCDAGATLNGPYLREMARLAHTEYFIEGRTSTDPREILRATMFAPTVTGSPLENACRVIQRYEHGGRGYYSGVLALIGRDGGGRRALDSSILIRAADIDRHGRLRIRVGATLVRHSDPYSEVAETHAKAAGLVSALSSDRTTRFSSDPEVREALRSRNEHISSFWLDHDSPCGEPVHGSVLILDAEDSFTAMLAHQLRSLGLTITVRRFDEPAEFDDYDLVVLGPGPGDPADEHDPRMRYLRDALRRLLLDGRPFLAVCLSHQVLSALLGFRMIRRDMPNQGLQREIRLFGADVRVGFYNTFAAVSEEDERVHELVPGVIEVSRDTSTGEVHGLRGNGFRSFQFHPESLLSEHGFQIIRETLRELLPVGTAGKVAR